MGPKEEECLMSLPYWGTEIPATMPPATECCSLVSSQTDRPHHYQASTPLWIEVQTGINREKRKEQCLGSALCRCRGSAVHICNSNAEAGALRQGCAGPRTSVSLSAQRGGGGE